MPAPGLVQDTANTRAQPSGLDPEVVWRSLDNMVEEFLRRLPSAILLRTAYDRRRVRFTVGIGYPESIKDARETIMRVVAETEGVLDHPGPWVYVSELAASSVNFTVYFWTESEQANVLRVRDRVATAIKLALDEAGIEIPYPHTVVLFHDATGTGEGDRIPEERTDQRALDERQAARDRLGASGRVRSAS